MSLPLAVTSSRRPGKWHKHHERAPWRACTGHARTCTHSTCFCPRQPNVPNTIHATACDKQPQPRPNTPAALLTSFIHPPPRKSSSRCRSPFAALPEPQNRGRHDTAGMAPPLPSCHRMGCYRSALTQHVLDEVVIVRNDHQRPRPSAWHH